MATRTRNRPGYTVTRLDTVAKRRRSGANNRTPWLWDNHLPPGALGMLDGDPGLGKSMITTDLAARVTKVGKWPDGTTVKGGPAGVLFICNEDSPEEIAARVEGAGGDLTRVFQLNESGGEMPSLPRDISIIREIITEHNVRLVVIDPIMVFLGVHAGSDQQVRKAVAPLAEMARQTGATVLLVRHLTKGGGANAKQAGGGSMGLIGQTRFGYLVGPDPEDPKRRIVACTKMNVGEEPGSLAYKIQTVRGKPRIVWEDSKVPVNIDANDLVRNRKVDSVQRNEREEAVAFLKDTMTHADEWGGLPGIINPNVLFTLGKDAGFTSSQLRTAKGKVGVVSRKLANGWFWCLPEHDVRKLGMAQIAELVARQEEAKAQEEMEKADKKANRKGGARPAKLTVVKQ